MKPTLLILAAGMGSRYGGLKQMDELGPSGESIIDYSIYDAIQAGFGKIVFVIRESFADDFKKAFEPKFSHLIKLEYAYQELHMVPAGVEFNKDREKPWGTSHAVHVAKDVINEPFAVINADDFYGADAFKVLADYLSNLKDENDYCMVGYELGKTLSEHGYVSRGCCIANEEGNLVSIDERTHIERKDGEIVYTLADDSEQNMTADTIVSMNMWGFHQSYMQRSEDMFVDFIKANFDKLKAEFYIPTVVDTLINDETIKLKVLHSPDEWFGVTYKEDKEFVMAKLQKLADEKKYPADLYK